MDLRKRCLGMLLVLPFLGDQPVFAQSPARASLGALPSPAAVTTATFECTGARASFAALVHPKRLTTFDFPSEVIQAISSSRALLVYHEHNKLTVQPRHGRTPSYGNLRVETKTCEAHIDLRLAERLEDAPILIDIRQHDEVAAELARIRAADAVRTRELGDKEKQLTDKEKQLATKETALEETITTALLLQDNTLRPVLAVAAPHTGDIRVALGANRKLGDAFLVAFKARNRGRHYGELQEVRVIDAAGGRLDARVTKVISPEQAGDNSLAVIPPGGHAIGVIKLPSAGRVNLGQLTFQFFLRGQMQPLLLRQDGWDEDGWYFPPTQEEVDRKKREEREKGKVSLHLLGMYGAQWLQDGQDLDRSDATSTKGLGVRLTYAFNPMFAFETEAMGASSGESRFDDVTWNGMQGELVRDVTLGRLLGGAVVRFGSDSVIPLVRGGLGFQAGSIGSRFLAGGSEVPGPEPSSVFAFAFYLGGGVDLRLGPVEAGLRLSGVQMSSLAPEPAIEAALHLGYSWKP